MSTFQWRFNRGLSAFDQRLRQVQSPTKFRFLSRHSSIIALMIEARQMKNSVECQNFNFCRGGMAKPNCVLDSNLAGDRNFSR